MSSTILETDRLVVGTFCGPAPGRDNDRKCWQITPLGDDVAVLYRAEVVELIIALVESLA